MKQETRFICTICGTRSAQPILCTDDRCPTEYMVHYAASSRKH